MRVRVFVFDDEPMIRRVFAVIACRRGYDVEVFRGVATCTPPEGMCPCASGERCADAIVMDYNMPGMSGLDLVEHLRARGCGCPHIALVSGFLTPEVAERAARMNVDTFSKPVEGWISSSGWRNAGGPSRPTGALSAAMARGRPRSFTTPRWPLRSNAP